MPAGISSKKKYSRWSGGSTRADKDPNYEIVWHLYRGMCVMDRTESASCVHEIVPKSKTKHWKAVENRVTLCNQHHEWAHKNTKLAAPILRTRAKEAQAYYGTRPPNTAGAIA